MKQTEEGEQTVVGHVIEELVERERAEEREQTRAQERERVALRMLADGGLSPEKIASILEMPIDEVMRYAEKARLSA